MNSAIEYVIKAGTQWQSYILTVDKDVARLFLDNMRDNRPARAKTVLRYRAQIRNNAWGFTGQPLIFNKSGKMMDGQHRCLAIIAEDAEVDVLVVLGIDDDAFKFLDQGAVRSGSDFLKARNATTTFAALRWIALEESGLLGKSAQSGLLANEAEAALGKHPGISEAVKRSLVCKSLLPPSLAAYAYYRMSRLDTAKCDEFFSLLVTGANMPERSPVLALRNRLLDNRAAKSRLPAIEILALVMKAWIKFTRDSQLSPVGLRWRGRRPGAPLPPQGAEPFPEWPQGALVAKVGS